MSKKEEARRARHCITQYDSTYYNLFQTILPMTRGYDIEHAHTVYLDCKTRIGVKDATTREYILAGTVCDFVIIEFHASCSSASTFRCSECTTNLLPYHIDGDDGKRSCIVYYLVGTRDEALRFENMKRSVKYYLEPDDSDVSTEELDECLLELKKRAVVIPCQWTINLAAVESMDDSS